MTDEQRGTLPALSEQELKGIMATMRSACDVVRIVNPSTFEAQTLNEAGTDLEKPYKCHSALCKSRRCENCISMRAIDEREPVSKFEFVDGDAYFITARPFDCGGEPRTVEMVQKVSDGVGLREGFEELREHIKEETDHEFVDSFTGTYTRKYFNDGLHSLRGRKVALVKVENLNAINRDEGYPVGDLVLKRVAREMQRCTRIVDSVIHYENDKFLVQFEDMDSEVFPGHIEEISHAVNAVAIEEHPHLVPQVKVVAVDNDGDYGELVDQALELLAEAEEAGERVLVRSTDAHHHAQAAVRSAATGETLLPEGEDRTADIDALTGLRTASAMRAYLQHVIEERRLDKDGYAVVYLDVENFKQFNRTYGMQGGDMLLKFVADNILEQFPNSFAAHLNGDVFVVVTSEGRLAERLETLRKRVASYQKRIVLELKAGVLELGEFMKDATAVIDLAKVACESIKGRYDLGVRFYDSELDQEISMNEYVVNNIENAIEQGHVKVFYQPIIRAMTGHVCDVEALCRWDDPQHGLLSPAVFIATLERFHLINKLDAYVVRQVCKDQANRVAAGMPIVPVSVNLSRLDFQLDDFFQVVENAVAEAGIPRSMLNIEVTESALDEGSSFFSEQVDRFRAAGYEVWMDDFGSGYSSLNLLKDYRFDALKIDMAFLAGFEDNPKSREIIVTIVDMAKKLGLRTLVEGVETKRQFRFLRRIGCEMLQGFYLGKPHPYSEEAFSEFVVEDASERAYYDRVGSVNLLGVPSGDEVSPSDVTELESRSMPMALVEFRDGNYAYLSANEAYLRFLEGVNATAIDDLQDSMEAGAYVMARPLVDHLDKVRETGFETPSLTVFDGENHQVYVRHIATSSHAHAFVIFPLVVR